MCGWGGLGLGGWRGEDDRQGWSPVLEGRGRIVWMGRIRIRRVEG